MKKLLVSLPVIALALVISSQSVEATVGGPTYVYNLRVSDRDAIARDIMYIRSDHGGRGCAPQVMVLDAQLNKTRELTGCDDADEAVLERAVRQYPVALNHLHLPYNSFRASTRIVKEVPENIATYEPAHIEFETTIYNRDNPVATLKHTGCYPTQPHIIEGYTLGKTRVVAFVLSTISGCWEGGYIREQIFPVSIIGFNDDPILVDPRISNEPALVDADAEMGNLLTVATTGPDKPAVPVSVSTTSTDTVHSSSNSADEVRYVYMIIIAVLALLLAAALIRKPVRKD